MQTPICSVLNKAYGGGGGEGISALHCEFMRQALGSSAVQSAELITSDVSHCLRRRREKAGRFSGLIIGEERPIAVRQKLRRTLTLLPPFLNTHSPSELPPPSVLFNTESHHATCLLC